MTLLLQVTVIACASMLMVHRLPLVADGAQELVRSQQRGGPGMTRQHNTQEQYRVRDWAMLNHSRVWGEVGLQH